jgi:chitin synthase
MNRRLEEHETLPPPPDKMHIDDGEPAEDFCLMDTEGPLVDGGSGSAQQAPRILACVTMWHETEEEMLEMLRSIVRMDEDQSARRLAKRYLKNVDPDFYEFESEFGRININCPLMNTPIFVCRYQFYLSLG